jgi:DNA invertase Pin-like site-specific DNA recombinase
MKIGYARVSTREQLLSMQVEALKEAGCIQIHEEIASGAKTARPVLDEIMRNLREGDTLVIWKLDRLGRNLAHLIHLTTKLIEKKVGLISLHDPIDTTTAQGRLIFGIFASLAEFERELIRERTQAGLKSARARGRKGGRPKGMSKSAMEKAIITEALYKNGSIAVKKIAQQLEISKTTLYLYLRSRRYRARIRAKNYHKELKKPVNTIFSAAYKGMSAFL